MLNHLRIIVFIILYSAILNASEIEQKSILVHSEEFKPEVNKKTPWFFSAQTSNSLAKDNPIGIGAAYSFNLTETWQITPRIYYSSNSSSENPDQDFRMTTSNNKKVIAIGGDTNSFKEEEFGVELLFGKKYSLSKKSSIEPYVGFGLSQGDFSSERTIETANEINPNSSRCSNLFGFGYNCNYYQLNNDLKYKTYNVISGASYSYILKNLTLSFFADLQLRKINFSTDKSSQAQLRGSEGAIFPNTLAAYGKPSENVIRIGAGIRF